MYVDIPCVEIAALLEESPVLLHAAPQGIEPRHAKLDAVFLSVWQRTVPAAQRLLCALTLFQQGFTRDDAQHLLGNDALQFEVDGHTEDGMAYLLKKSFLRFDRPAARYLMDPPLYHFVMGCRAEAADAAREATLRDRHADYFIARLHANAGAPPADPGEARFLAAWYDIRAALFRRLERSGTAAVVDDVNLAGDFFDLRSRHQDVIDFLDEVLARAQAAAPGDAPPPQWLFRKGDASYRSGRHHESKMTLLATLDLLGEPTDALRHERTRDPRILPELFTQIRLRLLPGGLKQPPAHAANLELRARVFAILVQIFFFDDESVLTEYVVLRAANLAEQAGAPVELRARGLVNLCVGLSLDPTTRGLARPYARLATRMAEALQHAADPRERAACAYVPVVLNLYGLAIGDIHAAQRHAALASRLNQELGKYRDDVTTGRDLAAYLTVVIEQSRAEGDSSVLLNLFSLLALISGRYALWDRLPDDLRQLHAQVKAADYTKVTDFFGYGAAAEAAVRTLYAVTRAGSETAAPQRAGVMGGLCDSGARATARIAPDALCVRWSRLATRPAPKPANRTVPPQCAFA